MYTIGIIREGKVPPDNRTPLTPRQCLDLVEKYPKKLRILVQWSAVRCYSEEDYTRFSIPVQESVEESDLLMGIKEVPIDMLLPGKTYMFFSHTHKKQPHNRAMLQAILDKNITLIDYELLTDENGIRLIGFGRWAGIVGAHYGLLMLGKRRGDYHLKPANQCLNLQELVDQYENLEFPPARFVITGGGRVAEGALQIMEHAGIRRVSPEELLEKEFEEPVFAQLHSDHLYRRKDGSAFDKHHFYTHPEEYESAFDPYLSHTDVLINCMFWDPRAPQLFQPEDTERQDFKMKTIADVSCDVNGSCSITTHVTYSDDPVFGYHPASGQTGQPYLVDTVDVMAIGNLPNELPRDASRDFGAIMIETVLPKYLETLGHDPLFERATIVKEGKLTERFSYLQDFVEGKE